jgi:hypothetical protein
VRLHPPRDFCKVEKGPKTAAPSLPPHCTPLPEVSQSRRMPTVHCSNKTASLRRSSMDNCPFKASASSSKQRSQVQPLVQPLPWVLRFPLVFVGPLGVVRFVGVVEVVGSNPAGPIGENPWFPCDSKGFFVWWSLVAAVLVPKCPRGNSIGTCPEQRQSVGSHGELRREIRQALAAPIPNGSAQSGSTDTSSPTPTLSVGATGRVLGSHSLAFQTDAQHRVA